jgi:type IV secretory pathway VirB4 component
MTVKRNYAKKTTIELSDEHYFFLKEKALVLQKQNKTASIVSIIRDLIEKDRTKWVKERRSHGA